jgi:uncharacterized protein YbjT (DUF2867 family)
MDQENPRVFRISFAKLYPLYVQKAEKKGRTKEEVDALVTYETPVRFAKQLLPLNPGTVLAHISGSHTDGSEQGRVMWARVKGRAENALAKLPFEAVYNFRPGLMKGVMRAVSALYPVMKLVFPGLTLGELGRATIASVATGAPKTVFEVADIRALL